MIYKYKLTAIAFAIALSIFIFQPVTSKISQPPAGNNGSPVTVPSGRTCAQCHSGASLRNSDGLVNIKIGENAPDSSLTGFNYGGSKNYFISFSPTVAGKRFGFQLNALTSSNTNAGTLSLSNTVNTSLVSTPITYVGHKNASALETWTFKWLSPASIIGDITFYYAFVAADSNDDSNNDTVYAGSTLIHSLVSGITNIEPVNNLLVFPNPVKEIMNISFDAEKAEPVQLNLFSLEGKLLKNLSATENTLHFNSSFNVEELPAGIYLLQIKAGEKLSCRKIVVE